MKKRRGCCATAIEATERLSWCRKKSEDCWTTASRQDYAERNSGSSPAGVVETFRFSYARPAGAVRVLTCHQHLPLLSGRSSRRTISLVGISLSYRSRRPGALMEELCMPIGLR